jgi:hypothetical protein|nr:hypothetical protein [uncultured Mediterranean phage uvMED]BAR25817.1 hypothetical protein [uncultured Mediterranean phage uvMED]
MFHAERFGKVPIVLLKRLIQIADQEQQQIINSHSVATAKLGMVVLSALGGGASNKAKIADFLPFETPRPATSITAETEEVVRWALRTQKLPASIVAMLGAELNS